jgi:hypothetical protein
VNSQILCLPDTPHSSTRPLNFLWYAVTTYKPLKHLSLAASLSARTLDAEPLVALRQRFFSLR